MSKSAFNLNSLKGRLAEQLIQDMFLQSDYNVFNYGIERVMPGFSNYLANAWFVIVSPEKIQCIHYNRLMEKFEISPSTNYSLKGIKSFHIDEALLEEYEKHAGLLFKGFVKG